MARIYLTLEVRWEMPKFEGIIGPPFSNDDYVFSIDSTELPYQLNYNVFGTKMSQLDSDSKHFILRLMSPELYDTYLNHRTNTKVFINRAIYTELP
jgi:hypothetical protein